MHMTYKGWKDDQDCASNIKEFITKHSECTKYESKPYKQIYSKYPISVLWTIVITGSKLLKRGVNSFIKSLFSPKSHEIIKHTTYF